MPSPAEQAFHGDMVAGYERLKREIGYTATRFMQMVADHGGVGAARLLLRGTDASDGFTRLWEAGRLDMSLEFHVLMPEYEELFTDEERAVARRRLEAHKFDVDAALRRRSSEREPPP